MEQRSSKSQLLKLESEVEIEVCVPELWLPTVIPPVIDEILSAKSQFLEFVSAAAIGDCVSESLLSKVKFCMHDVGQTLKSLLSTLLFEVVVELQLGEISNIGLEVVVTAQKQTPQ